MIRDPAFSGQFYPAVYAVLKGQVEKLVVQTTDKLKAYGVISPHAALVYSGAVSGKVFSAVNPASTYIIIGPNHTGRGRPFSLMAKGAWKTPLGRVDIDEGLAASLLKNSLLLQDDEVAHSFEHSVEVQLPFIQYLNESFKFVPMVLSCSDLPAYRQIGQDIAKSIKESGSDVLIVASNDMTHYELDRTARAKDKEAINAILELDEEKLLRKIRELDITMCGYAPVVTMLVASKALGAKKARLIEYKTSADTTADYSAVVGYAGMVIY